MRTQPRVQEVVHISDPCWAAFSRRTRSCPSWGNRRASIATRTHTATPYCISALMATTRLLFRSGCLLSRGQWGGGLAYAGFQSLRGEPIDPIGLAVAAGVGAVSGGASVFATSAVAIAGIGAGSNTAQQVLVPAIKGEPIDLS